MNVSMLSSELTEGIYRQEIKTLLGFLDLTVSWGDLGGGDIEDLLG